MLTENQFIKNNSQDTEDRIKIQSRIRELKKLGFPKEEALKRLASEYSKSGYIGFFEGWVDNIYKKSKDKRDRYSRRGTKIESEER